MRRKRLQADQISKPPLVKSTTIAVVIPAYNEEKKIGRTIAAVPERATRIYVVNDASTDETVAVIQECAQRDPRVVLVDMKKNVGVGGAIVAGYEQVIASGEDIAVVMAGDGQMDPADFDSVVEPVESGICDYAKGNRFIGHQSQISEIPKHRLFGNLMLSVLTKIASGYWHISDSQSGYTAINRAALLAVDWSQCYPRYGCPNDYLVRLNIANMRVADVPIRAVYGPEWSSHMRPHLIAWPLLRLLLRLFLSRMFQKYTVANGHPIVIFYSVCFVGFICNAALLIYILLKTVFTGIIPQTATILWGMSGMVSIQLLLQSFEMDYRDNEWLFVHKGAK
jgi:glycosyltransferase involved in cell wall biosynthesis